MAKVNWMEKLQKLDGAIIERKNPFMDVLRSPSPSVNFTFGNTHGLPKNYGAILYGPRSGGKSLLLNLMIGQLHQDDPEAIAVKYDTEARDELQLQERDMVKFGIDPKRYLAFKTNEPKFIFDPIAKDIVGRIQEGCPIKLIAIDSINNIRGRRSLDATTIDTMQRGDEALTLQEGFKWIHTAVRNYGVGLIVTAHIRAEQDANEIRKGNTIRLGAANAVQHFFEYFVYVDIDKTKAGSTDIAGNKFTDANLTDMADKEEQTGFKVRCTMKKSTIGPIGRVGEFTFDFKKGIINVHEEVFLLGVARNVIEKVTSMTYGFGGQTWVGKQAMITAIKDNVELQEAIVKKIRQLDIDNPNFEHEAVNVEE